MIELDDLKNIWKDKIDFNINLQHVEREKLRELLNRRSTNIIDRLRKNLLLEIGMFCFCLLLIACVPFYFQHIS